MIGGIKGDSSEWWMVYTRSERRRMMAEMGDESHVVGESCHNTIETFINRILERMEELDSFWTLKMAGVTKDQEGNEKMREEFDELQT